MWTDPHTYLVGELATATLLNQDIRDNLLYLYTPPTFRVTRFSNQSIPNATFTTVSFTAEEIDTDGGFTATADFVNINTAGRYFHSALSKWTVNANGTRFMTVAGSPTQYCEIDNANNVPTLTVGGFADVNVGFDYQLTVFQSSGAALNLAEGVLNGLWVGPV